MLPRGLWPRGNPAPLRRGCWVSRLRRRCSRMRSGPKRGERRSCSRRRAILGFSSPGACIWRLSKDLVQGAKAPWNLPPRGGGAVDRALSAACRLGFEKLIPFPMPSPARRDGDRHRKFGDGFSQPNQNRAIDGAVFSPLHHHRHPYPHPTAHWYACRRRKSWAIALGRRQWRMHRLVGAWVLGHLSDVVISQPSADIRTNRPLEGEAG